GRRKGPRPPYLATIAGHDHSVSPIARLRKPWLIESPSTTSLCLGRSWATDVGLTTPLGRGSGIGTRGSHPIVSTISGGVFAGVGGRPPRRPGLLPAAPVDS